MTAIDLLGEAEKLAGELEAQARSQARGSVAERRVMCARSAASALRELVWIDQHDVESPRPAPDTRLIGTCPTCGDRCPGGATCQCADRACPCWRAGRGERAAAERAP